MPQQNPLPPKENTLFKRILRSYEQKQYKNGLKFCKQILSNPKYSDHGETLAMKGLIMNSMGRKDEAYEHVRRGLKNNLMSHVCWHVYGLLQRSDRKYDEAVKCYRNALKWEKENLQILRDLSLLQIQLRDLEGYRDTRYQLLALRPTQRASWIGYAMSYQLLKDFDLAYKILDEFRGTYVPKPFDYEHSEMLLYMNSVLKEAGRYEDALKFLDDHSKEIVDKVALFESMGELNLKLELWDQAEKVYWELLDRSPENKAYYKGLELSCRPDTVVKRLEIYEKAQKLYPRAMCPWRIPMDFTTGETFKEYAKRMLIAGIRKGMQPLFVIFRELYCDPEKVRVVEELVHSFDKNLTELHKFFPDDGDSREDPTCELFAWFFLAQHYDYLQQYTNAMKYINKCLEHTGTFIEAHSIKGQIYKHAGDINAAVRCLDETQALDTADRFMNCWCARYMLRADMISEAEAMCSKFTREGTSAMDNLNEMQCMWFQTDVAYAHYRLRKFGESLKMCRQIDRHFTEIVEDQFDFHTYCLRKMTLTAYVELLRLEDVVRKHPFYFTAAVLAIQIYIQLHDKPLSQTGDDEDMNLANLTPAEVRRIKNKQKKKARKEAQQKEREKQEEVQQQKKKDPKKTEDPEGPKFEELDPEKLARPENPLEEAVYFLKPLLSLARDKVETFRLAFEVYYRKDKLLLMAQALSGGLQLEPSDAHLHMSKVKFLKKVKELDQSALHPHVQQVLSTMMSDIFSDTDPLSLNQTCLTDHPNSLPHQLAGARMMNLLDPSKKASALSLITSLSPQYTNLTHEMCTEVLDVLKSGEFGNDCDQIITDYKDAAHALFPLAKAFRPDSIIQEPLPNGDVTSQEVDSEFTCDHESFRNSIEL